MEDKQEIKEKKKCNKCGAFIDNKYEMCSVCNEQYSNEIAIFDKFKNDDIKTVNFYKLKLIEKFQNHDKVVLSFIKKYMYIADRIINDIKHMGFQQDKRYSQKEKSKNPPYLELEYIKAPLILIPAVKAWKKDTKWYD